MHGRKRKRQPRSRIAAMALALPFLACGTRALGEEGPLFHDAHFHLTNYVQQGPSIQEHLAVMGRSVGRSTLFGIPLQQTWSYENSGEFAPTYYLQTDAPLYYYSFTDAWIATQYLSLSPADRARFDPMITGFNPADMYGVDHIRRVLETFPGVFSGIGEFSIHKEFVSSKVAGEIASLTDPALDRILAFVAETGLVVIFHNDIDVPFAKGQPQPIYLDQTKALLRRHPNATIIWAHTGLGRVVQPTGAQAAIGSARRPATHLSILEAILRDPSLRHVHFDISWDEVAKYVIHSTETVRRTAELIDRFPDRFLFGTDNVAPKDQATHLNVYRMYDPLWRALSPEVRQKVQLDNYERLFDEARRRVRAWERENVGR